MKNVILFIALAMGLCLVYPTAYGQQLTANTPQLIADGGTQPVLSPKGDYLLVRDAGEAGLTRIELSTGQRTLVASESDIDGNVLFSDGGTMVAYKTIEYRNHMPYRTIKVANLQTGKIKVLDQPARESFPFRFAGGKMKIAKRTTMRSQRLLTDIRTVEHEYVLAIEDDDLVLYDGNVRKVLNPNGKNIYLWEQISPDEQHIVYVAVNDGCHTFVCDINGKNVVDLGYYIGAPTWMGNNWIIGQQDEDDGHQMTASRLVAIHPDGSDFQILQTQNLTMPINPNASSDGKIAFENKGKIYLMEVK